MNENNLECTKRMEEIILKQYFPAAAQCPTGSYRNSSNQCEEMKNAFKVNKKILMLLF